MAQVDILLRQLPENFDITVGCQKSFDITVNNESTPYNVYIYDLVDRQGIYGDELDPIILHLSESSIDCLINVSLLDSAFLYRYNDRLLEDIDPYPLFVLDHGGGYNYTALKSSAVDTNSISYIKPKRHTMFLETEADISLNAAIQTKHCDIPLSTLCDVTDETILKIPQLTADLQTYVNSDMTNICELMLNASGIHWFDGYLYEYDSQLLSEMDLTYPKMSLETVCRNMYMRFSFARIEHNIKLTGSIDNLFTSLNIKNMNASDICLKTDASFVSEVICSCIPSITDYNIDYLNEIDPYLLADMDYRRTALSQSVVPLDTELYISADGSDVKFINDITESICTHSILDVSVQNKLGTSITEDVELHYGLGRYDNKYLCYWDSHTISDMATEVINESNGSVDT